MLFIGVSDPEDIDEVEDGDILDWLVVRPSGRLKLVLDDDAGPPLTVTPEGLCEDINPAPNVLEYVSRIDTSGAEALAAKCCAATGP